MITIVTRKKCQYFLERLDSCYAGHKK